MKYSHCKSKKEITAEIEEYLKDNYQSETLAQMAKRFKVSDYKVQCWMIELGLKKHTRARRTKEVNCDDGNGFFQHDMHLATI